MSPDRGIRLHRRQFVVGPRPHLVGDDWMAIDIGHGLWLSHCPDLRLAALRDRGGQRWWLLGLATQTRVDRPDPAQQLSETETTSVPEAYEGWAGRWWLVGGGRIHLDAGAQLGCYWTATGDGAIWASSSPAVIAALPGVGDSRSLELTYERGLSWVAPPLGRRQGIRRLLASEVLDATTGVTHWRRLVTPPDQLPDDDPLAAFADAIGRAMANLPGQQPKLMALTAGADSRVVLAAALAADVELTVVTRRASRMSVADRVVPPRLAAGVGLEHRELRPKRPEGWRWELAARHTDHNVSDGDALPFVEGVRDDLVGFEIGGQGFGFGKVKNRHFPDEIGRPGETAGLVADHFGEPAWSANRQALASWLLEVDRQQRDGGDQHQVDWRDRFYLEQRMAGWQAPKEQLYDLHRHERFFPINSARTFGLLLAVEEERRRGAAHQRELIAAIDDRLMAEPFNPEGRSFSPARRLGHILRVDRTGAPKRLGRRLLNSNDR